MGHSSRIEQLAGAVCRPAQQLCLGNADFQAAEWIFLLEKTQPFLQRLGTVAEDSKCAAILGPTRLHHEAEIQNLGWETSNFGVPYVVSEYFLKNGLGYAKGPEEEKIFWSEPKFNFSRSYRNFGSLNGDALCRSVSREYQRVWPPSSAGGLTAELLPVLPAPPIDAWKSRQHWLPIELWKLRGNSSPRQPGVSVISI